MKRKKLLAPKTETVTVDPVSAGQVQHTSDKLVTDLSAPVRSISNTMAANIAPRPPSSSHGPTTDRPKQERLKSSANNQNSTTVSEVLVKKKAKRKPEAELDNGQTRPEKSTSAQAEEKRKSSKQMIGSIAKPVTQPPVAPASAGAPPAKPLVNSSVDMV